MNIKLDKSTCTKIDAYMNESTIMSENERLTYQYLINPSQPRVATLHCSKGDVKDKKNSKMTKPDGFDHALQKTGPIVVFLKHHYRPIWAIAAFVIVAFTKRYHRPNFF